MYKNLVRFPAIGTHVITSPSNQEIHSGSPTMIALMCYNLADLEFLFVLLSYIHWIGVMRVKDRGVDFCIRLPQVFNDVNRMLMSDDWVRSLMFGK